MKKKRKIPHKFISKPAAASFMGNNPRLNAQTRKVLRAHYAAKYRTR